METVKWTEKQTNRHNRHTIIKTDKWTDKQTNRHNRHKSIKTIRWTDKQTDRHDRKLVWTNRQIDILVWKQPDRQTNKQT